MNYHYKDRIKVPKPLDHEAIREANHANIKRRATKKDILRLLTSEHVSQPVKTMAVKAMAV